MPSPNGGLKYQGHSASGRVGSNAKVIFSVTSYCLFANRGNDDQKISPILLYINVDKRAL